MHVRKMSEGSCEVMQRRAVLSVRFAWSTSRDLRVCTVSGMGLSRQQATVLVLTCDIRSGQLLAVLRCLVPDVETHLVLANRRQHTMLCTTGGQANRTVLTRGRGETDE
jgi:hypothetical protein